ncbi:MAG: response regulator [Clostridia bacterium]|nr:response regulator [Clostridia bacterium]
MDKPLAVVIVEDDCAACAQLIEYAETVDKLTVVGATNNTSKALEYICTCQPDALILDLELHFGSGSGLQLLENMRRRRLSKTPFVLITTNNSSAVTYEYARQLGADYIMYKHQEGYSAKSVIDFLVTMRTVIQNRAPSTQSDFDFSQSISEKNTALTKTISNLLDTIGISPKAVGYQYLIDAISIAVEGKTPNICTIIGEKHQKTDSSVERAMQNAINKAWRTTDIDALLEHYTAKINSEKGVPTVTEFIYHYANKVKNN